MVLKILVQNPDERIPLVKVFVHPWVLFLQEKFNITREKLSDSESESEELNSSDEEDFDEEEDLSDQFSEEEETKKLV